MYLAAVKSSHKEQHQAPLRSKFTEKMQNSYPAGGIKGTRYMNSVRVAVDRKTNSSLKWQCSIIVIIVRATGVGSAKGYNK